MKKKDRLAVLTYNVAHRKTYDTLCLLKARGYDSVTVFAQSMTYTKKRQPTVTHRPGLSFFIPEPQILCSNLEYKYIEGEFKTTVCNEWEDALLLLCGAGLLDERFVHAHKIINSHPGYVPYARGLDAYKWSIWHDLPIGVTAHFLGDYVDAGEMIERREIEVKRYDTFHSVAQRIYENEIDMLVGAVEKVDEEHTFIIPDSDSVIFKRMPEEKERELLKRFEEYKVKRCGDYDN